MIVTEMKLVDTRWNSSFVVFQRLFEQREPLGGLPWHLREPTQCLSVWRNMRPFHQATVELSEERVRVKGNSTNKNVKTCYCCWILPKRLLVLVPHYTTTWTIIWMRNVVTWKRSNPPPVCGQDPRTGACQPYWSWVDRRCASAACSNLCRWRARRLVGFAGKPCAVSTARQQCICHLEDPEVLHVEYCCNRSPKSSFCSVLIVSGLMIRFYEVWTAKKTHKIHFFQDGSNCIPAGLLRHWTRPCLSFCLLGIWESNIWQNQRNIGQHAGHNIL